MGLKPDKLARFRADPSEVRVSLRREGNVWLARITDRAEVSGVIVQARNRSPLKALVKALRAAEGTIPGIDINMQWSYEHPQGASGVSHSCAQER